MTEAYPLQWPLGRSRTRNAAVSRFDQTNGRAISFCLDQIRMLGGRQSVISTNIQLRQDGLPYANRRPPDDAGVAVYFTYKGRQMCFACDKWRDVYDNIYAIGKTIEALRGIERWGTGDMVEQAFTGFVALPAPKSPHEVVGVKPGASIEEIESAFRARAKQLHSDKGGDDTEMAELLEARRKLKEEAA
jgi:hypothetical protein